MTAAYPFQSAPPPARDWTAERGQLYWKGKCDLAGSFPGFAQHGAFITKARVHITASYFLVEEDHARGFGLPLQSITSAFVVDLHDRGDSLVRLQYVDGELTRTFTVRFCGPLAALRPGHRARQMLQAVQATGETQVLTSHALPEPELLVPWAAAHQYQHEPVHWHDRALAPMILGESLRPSDVWLTDASLIWGCGSGNGINRLPLGMITDVIPAHVEDRAGTPAVYVGFADEAGRRHEVPFLFNRAPTTAENEQHEIAMLNVLRAHGIPLGAANGRLQPWRIDFQEPSRVAAQAIAPEPGSAVDHQRPLTPPPLPLAVPPVQPADTARQPAEQTPPIETNVTAPEVVTVESVETPLPSIDPVSDVGITGEPAAMTAPSTAADPVMDDDAAVDRAAADMLIAAELPATDKPSTLADHPDPDVPVEPDSTAGVVDAALFPRFRQLEAIAIANLAAMLQEIDNSLTGNGAGGAAPSSPTPAEQSLAYHELADAAIAGHMTWEDVRQRRARLTAIIEATPRLRTLLELHDSGHLDDAVLQRKRLEVKDELSSLVMAR